MLHKLAAKLAALRSDRGEGPVPYIILVGLVALVAVFVGGAIMVIAEGWVGDLPEGPNP
ncbi:hypothetical protein [Allorhizocola rhizosphaerae]|uniref:hypothetical protein n=1 Tax=Allorhizocola rhizosphaerae TaxID=1872709 RepID=UPI0013C360AD|nr:hypothetical protein [Allorhizocola rhizosphaerae]